MWNRFAPHGALLFELRFCSVCFAADARQALAEAARRSNHCRGLPWAGPGKRMGCRRGPHHRRDPGMLLRRAVWNRLPGRVDRNSGGTAWPAGQHLSRQPGGVSSKGMSVFNSSSGVNLAYSDTGIGLPVVFLHPTPLDHDYWRPLTALLPDLRAIAPDLRGHGASELGSSLPVGGFARVADAPVLTMRQLARDTLELLDQLSIER